MEIVIYVIIFIITCIIYIALTPLRTAYTFLRITLSSAKALKQFPTEHHHWFFGHLTTHPGPGHEGLAKSLEWCQKNPRYYVLYLGPLRPVLVLNHPETVKQILKTSEPKNFIGGGGYQFLRPWIGDGLLLSSGNKWFRNRKLLTPGFHFDILKPYMDVYNTCVDLMLEKFEQASKNHVAMDIYNPVSLCTLDIILRCAFSTTKNIQVTEKETDPYVTTVGSLAKAIVARSINPIYYIDSFYYRSKVGQQFRDECNYSHKVADGVISQRQRALEDASSENIRTERKYVDFLDILLLARDDEGNGLTKQEIRDEVETFMFEGHDTTASGITWILYNLAKNPDIQERARLEVDAILEDRPNDSLLWEDMSRLSYLTMCIKESLRLHPAVHLISRETTKPSYIDDKPIPPGTIIDINIYNVHHNETVWEEPMRYNPDRFLPENTKGMDSYAFIPFSAGPRNCIGQNFAMNEMKTTVARVLRKFKFRVETAQEARIWPDLVLRPETTIPLTFELR